MFVYVFSCLCLQCCPVFEVELFEMGIWSLGLGALGAAIAGIFLANTDLCLTKAAQASLEYLEDADLHSTGDGTRAQVLIFYHHIETLHRP
ncbi:unnamed protein product [Oncorhynchus mykiss]|uniref:Uncharacterized protein n=1 Tax=Oncorhynchus mykiss TaxID=8022 RepID=A0A060Z8K2_ONCMY|nr:unnamed protein product [Oncorhynchus mykiss]